MTASLDRACCPQATPGTSVSDQRRCSSGWSRGATGPGRRQGVLRARGRAAVRDRPGDARVPPRAEAAARRLRRRPPRRLRRWSTTTDRYGEYAKAVLDEAARLCGGDGAGGDRPARADRPGDAARLQLEAGPVRDDRGARRRPGAPSGSRPTASPCPTSSDPPRRVRRCARTSGGRHDSPQPHAQRLGLALGRRRRRRLPRVPHQGERHRRRRAGDDRADGRSPAGDVSRRW